MARQYANINPEILKWGRKTVKLTSELAAKRVKVSHEKLLEWENGNSKPTIKQLYKIADVYRRPFAVFYFPEPPKHFKPLKDFRKFELHYSLSDEEEYQLQKEILLFQRKRQQAIELHDLLELPVEKFKLKSHIEKTPQDLAKEIIDYLRINHKEIANTSPGYDALNYWKSFLESKGILVFQTTRVPLEVMRGACIAKETLPVIIINSNDSQNGRIFSLFHELTHIVLREDAISNFRYSNKEMHDKIEIFCNQVAAEVLVPESHILNYPLVSDKPSVDTSWSKEELKIISRHFCVSPEVILRRLLTLNKTTRFYYQEYRDSIKSVSYSKPKGGNYYRNVIAKNGKLFLDLALQGYYQEKLTASSLYDYTKVKLSNLNKLEKTLYAQL